MPRHFFRHGQSRRKLSTASIKNVKAYSVDRWRYDNNCTPVSNREHSISCYHERNLKIIWRHNAMTQEYRTEKDSLGEMRVPADALFGAQTQRAVINFPVSGMRPY